MRTDPSAVFTIDRGAATTAAAILGRPGARWRLLASTAVPAGVDIATVLDHLLRRVHAADPALIGAVAGLGGAVPYAEVAAAAREWRRIETASAPPRRCVVLAASNRQVALLDRAARRAGWRTTTASAEDVDPLEMTRLALDPDVDLLVVGAGDPPGADERDAVAELAALAAAVDRRRPDLQVVLAGGMIEHAAAFDVTPRALAERIGSSPAGPPAELVLAPAATAGSPPGEALQALLGSLRSGPTDSRPAIVRATASLAVVLDRRIETLELGFDGGLRAQARPAGDGETASVSRAAVLAEAALVPPDPDETVVDRVFGWCPLPLDRTRLLDRLREFRLAPWAEPAGDGAVLRLSIARAALERLTAATPELGEGPVPDLTIAAGGIWAGAPPPAVTLALADVVRRPGATQLTVDHARLLGPLGTIDDEAERLALLADLADDLLAPLGSVIMARGLRAGRTAGQLRLASAGGASDLELVPGGIELVDLPPGRLGTLDLEFRDTVHVGARGRHFAFEVAGGLGGLLVDLRDVPLRLPDRPERRRDVLGGWQRAIWTGLDR